MNNFSTITIISLIGTIIFAYLWYRTCPDKEYETVEMERVSLKGFFLVMAVVCFGFLLASLLVWK